MNLGDTYTWVKGLHVAAVLTFIGGTLAVALAPAGVATGPEPGAALIRLLNWDRRVTLPAMLLTWALGLTLASLGHWYAEPWLQAKLVAVAMLSGLHGINSGRLATLASASPQRPLPPTLVIVLAAIIALLAVVKPG